MYVCVYVCAKCYKKTTGKTFHSEKKRKTLLAVFYEDSCLIMDCFKKDYILIVRESMTDDDLPRRSLLALEEIN